MIVFACRIDGTKLGEFEEPEFRAKVSAGELTAEDYYWHEGMPDWKPISDYRLLAKTQRISFAPPMRSTIKIDIEPSVAPKPPTTGPRNFISRLFDRKRGK